MSHISNLNELIDAFNFEGSFAKAEQIHAGHINSTFVVDFTDNNGNLHQYLLQQINTFVFKNPDKLMENIVGVTSHVHNYIVEHGGNPDREGLYVYHTKDGNPYYVDSDGKHWRCYNYIYDAHSYQAVENPEVFYNAAKTFGKFQEMLADYPIDSLYETIPNFHNTVSRISDFKKAVADNLSGRADSVKEEIAFVLDREQDCHILVDLIESGDLPLKVTHNDTKLNNIMFDNETNQGICVVDLDTVMPGLSLYDFGDSIRFGANTAAEDEKDLSKVSLSLEYFEAYVKGYLESAGKSLTAKEIECLPISAKLMTLECGMRFLGDYINGDVYFKTGYPEHNLDRAHTQLVLVKDMEAKFDEMTAIVEKHRKALGLR